MGTRNLRLYLILECILVMFQCSESLIISKKYEDRLTGGKKASKSAFPFVVGMETLDGQRYSGILVSTDRVLTVAQLKDTCKQNVKVYIGAYEFEDLKEKGRINLEVRCSDVISHDKYDPISGDNDIAMIKLPEKVILTDQIAIAKLPDRINGSLYGEQVTVMGWGSRNINLPTELRFYNHSVIHSEPHCERDHNVTKNQICVQTKIVTGSVCTGDGGAPAYAYLTLKSVVGLASRLLDDCKFRRPNVFTRLPSYLDWISNNMK